MSRLSPRSRYQRFLGATASLSERSLRYLTEIDHVDHLAWIAIDPATPEGRALGVARCVRDRADPSVAEVAVFVADEVAGRGLGSLLLHVLAESAAARGVATLRAAVLRDNANVVHALQELGVYGAVAGGVLHVDVPLSEARRLAASWIDAREEAVT